MSTNEVKKLRIASYGSGGFSLGDLLAEEVEILLGSFESGHSWVRRGADGRIEHVPSFKPLPGPVTDETMHPYWQSSREVAGVQLELFPLDERGGRPSSPHEDSSICIQHLCGYNYTPANYKRTAEFLSRCGFVCMRSARDRYSGQFWEIWYLPGVWSAKGPLREEIVRSGKTVPAEKTAAAVTFLGRTVQFGTLDVAAQRLAMVIAD